MKIILNEDEKNQISSQHEEIDSRIFNFLMRRIKKEKKDLGTDWFDDKKLTVTEYTFEGLPGFGWNSYSTKKQIENKILDMLIESDVIDFWPYELDERDPRRIKIVKTVRKFINFILTD